MAFLRHCLHELRLRQCLDELGIRSEDRQLCTQISALIAAHPTLGWRLADSASAIQPLVVGDNDGALALAVALDAQGLSVPAIRPPAVPSSTARLRITLSAAHSAGDVRQLTAGLTYAAKELSGPHP